MKIFCQKAPFLKQFVESGRSIMRRRREEIARLVQKQVSELVSGSVVDVDMLHGSQERPLVGRIWISHQRFRKLCEQLVKLQVVGENAEVSKSPCLVPPAV